MTIGGFASIPNNLYHLGWKVNGCCCAVNLHQYFGCHKLIFRTHKRTHAYTYAHTHIHTQQKHFALHLTENFMKMFTMKFCTHYRQIFHCDSIAKIVSITSKYLRYPRSVLIRSIITLSLGWYRPMYTMVTALQAWQFRLRQASWHDFSLSPKVTDSSPLSFFST